MNKNSKVTSVIIASGIVCIAYGLFALSGQGIHRSTTLDSRYVPQTRTYYIAAENVIWDYAPAGKDPLTNDPIPSPWGNQTKYNKVRYIEYTDGTFTVKKAQPNWLGILGPIIRGVEGDTIKVVFYNKADKPYSMHPHGLRYDKDNEGSSMEMNPEMAASAPMPTNDGLEGKGAQVQPGEKYTYTWSVIPDSAPKEGEGGSKVWWYHSHVDPVQDLYDGLLGPIIVTSAKHAKPDGTPDDVDKEFVTMFMIFDESKPGMTADQKEGSMKHAINGLIFDNLQGLVMNKGDKVRWHLLGMGNEVDIHTPHWHGGVVLNRESNVYTDVVELLPGSMKTVDMLADNPGQWMYHCHVFDHIKAGMFTMYTINP
jgi:FtsP/CotA-like multicopper oxidase with cupredoxin domain